MRIKQHFLADYLPSILLAGLLLFLPLVYWEAAKSASSLPRYILIGFYSCILLFSWIFLVARNNAIVWHPIFLLMLLFVFWAGFSSIWSVDPSNTYNTTLQLISFILISFYAAQIVNTESRLLVVLYAAIAGGVIVSIIGIQQAYGNNILDYRQSAPPASTFINKNFAAIYLDIITPLAFIAILLVSKNTHRWLFAICFSLILSYQILTVSRGSWLAILVFLFAFIFLLFRDVDFRQAIKKRLLDSRPQFIVAILLVFLVVWFPLQHSNIFQKKLAGTVDSSLTVRLNANINALGMVADKPLTGVGYGAFMLGFRPYMFKYVPINEVSEYKYLHNLHNDPLQVFVELGIPGGILAFGIYIWSLLLTIKIIQGGKSVNDRLVGIGLFLSLLSFGTHALVSFPLNKPTSALMFWVLIGITIGLYSKTYRVNTERKSFSNTILLGLALFGILFLLFNFRHHIHYYTNSVYFQVLEQKMVARECDSALKIAEHIDFKTNLNLRVYYPTVYGNCDPGEKILLQKINPVIDYDPNNTLARIVRGKHYLESQQSKLAADDFLVVISILPHRAIGYIGLGNAATQEGKYTLAEKLYRKALELEPQNETALLMLSRLENRPQ